MADEFINDAIDDCAEAEQRCLDLLAVLDGCGAEWIEARQAACHALDAIHAAAGVVALIAARQAA